jgi:hypothetical protein
MAGFEIPFNRSSTPWRGPRRRRGLGGGLAAGKAKGSGPFGGGGGGGGAAGGFAAAGGRQTRGILWSFFMIIEIRDLHSVATYPLQHEGITDATRHDTTTSYAPVTTHQLAPRTHARRTGWPRSLVAAPDLNDMVSTPKHSTRLSP